MRKGDENLTPEERAQVEEFDQRMLGTDFDSYMNNKYLQIGACFIFLIIYGVFFLR